MGKITDFLQNQGGIGAPDNMVLTELGDPDFSPAQGSQAQVPAAAAQSKIFDNMRRAQNQVSLATSLGYDVADPDWEPIHQQAETGFVEDAGSFVGSLVGWIDGPRQAINLLLQDMLGGEAPEGFENPNFGDYWTTFWGGVNDPDELEERTGLDPISGSKTLELFGWEEYDELDVFGRVTRGIADFGLQVLTDPLTYVTFGLSGLGKKAALAAGESLQKGAVNRLLQATKGAIDVDQLTKYEQLLFSQKDEIVDSFSDALRRKADELGGALPKDMEAGFNRYFGRNHAVWENMTEAAFVDRVHRDVIRPLMGRNFKAIDSLALEELPAWAQGGARLSVPFTQNTLSKGLLVPGTQGLGRQLVGNPMRALSAGLKTHAPGFGYLADQVSKGVSKMDQMAPLIRALKNGEIEGWQWHIASTAIDNMHNNVARHTISTELNAHWNRINQLAKANDIDVSDIGADIFFRLEGDNISEGMLDQVRKLAGEEAGLKPSQLDRLSPELRQQIDDTVSYMQMTMQSYHDALSVLDPSFTDKFIKGYIPHSPTKEGRKIMQLLAGTKAGTTGVGDAKADLFAQMLNASGRGGKAEMAMGANRHETRQLGRANVLAYADDGPLQFDRNAMGELAADPTVRPLVDGVVNEDALELRYLPTPVLNRMLKPMVEEAAQKFNKVLPANWDGTLFNENPIDVMLDYVNSMSDTIQAWSTVEALRASGLAFNHSVELDVQKVIQKMMGNIVHSAARVPTVKAGIPKQGETMNAPVDWLERVVDPENVGNAQKALRGELEHTFHLPGGAQTADAQVFKESIAELGVQKPIVLEVYEDGGVQILNGHHRLVEAKAQGIKELPVVFRRGINETGRVKNDVNIRHILKDDWGFAGPGEFEALYDDILANPDTYVFHGTTKKSAKNISPQAGEPSFEGGGFYHSREAAEDFARQRRSIDGEGAVLIFRKDELPPFLQRALEKGDVGRAFDGVDPKSIPAIRPVGSYDTDKGFVSLAQRQIDDLTDFEGWQALRETPWSPAIAEDKLSLLHGGKDQGRIPGVSRSIEMQVDDTKVMSWQTLEDVAETRRLHRRLISTTEQEWITDTPTPPLELVHEPPEGAAWHWKNHVADDGTDIKVFYKGEPPGIEGSVKSGKEGLGGLTDAQRAKQERAARAIARKNNAEPPNLTMAVRGSDASNGVKLNIKFNPFATIMETRNARRAAIKQLDREFSEGGTFFGKFNDTGIAEIVDSGLDETTANVLRDYVTMKIGTLGRDAIEYISKEPAEVFVTRALYDKWEQGINDFVKRYSARLQDGRLIADTEKIGILGTDEVAEQLAGLKRAALTLGERGYNMAVDVMQDVEAYTGVKKLAGYVSPEKFNLAGPAVENLQIQQDIAEWLSLTARNMGAMYTPEGIAAAKLATRETLKWWRAMATLPRPAFHIRNTVGGSWMNMNFGVKTATMKRAAQWGVVFRKALANASGTDGLEQAFKRLPAKEARAWRAAWDENVLAGFATTEFSNAVTPAAKRERWGWAKAWDVDNFALTRAGGKVMETTEDFMRMSLFLQYYDETVPGSAKTAAAIVNAVHFDYSNLTPTETKLKSIIPFFVWTRRNLPLQVQSMVENPRYVQRYRAMMQAMNDNLGGNDEENLPMGDHFSAYAAGTSYKVNPDTPFWARLVIDPDLPISDLLSLPNPEPGALIEWANNILGPHISLISDINASREFGDVNAPAPFNGVMQSLAAIGFYDRTLDGDVRIPYLMRTILETAVPFSREIFDPLTGGPTDPGRQQRMGIAEDDGFLESASKSLAGQLAGGVGAKLTTPADVRGATFRSDAELTELIESLRLQGKAPLSQP